VGPQRVRRLRRLTPGQTSRLDALRKVARLLDTAFPVPGTSARFGLDPILGLIPGLGDLVAPLFTLGLILQARDIGVPGVVLFRMIANVAIDTIVGLVPLAGDLFDFAWKSNVRNLALLEQHAYEEHSALAGDWTFVIMSIALLLIIAAVPFLVVGWLIGVLSGVWR
jgi:hypothetical protein